MLAVCRFVAEQVVGSFHVLPGPRRSLLPLEALLRAAGGLRTLCMLACRSFHAGSWCGAGLRSLFSQDLHRLCALRHPSPSRLPFVAHLSWSLLAALDSFRRLCSLMRLLFSWPLLRLFARFLTACRFFFLSCLSCWFFSPRTRGLLFEAPPSPASFRFTQPLLFHLYSSRAPGVTLLLFLLQ